MKTRLMIAALAILALTAPPLASPAQAAISQPLVSAETQFTVALYSRLNKQPGNLFFSPSSISTALGMLLAGAKSTTAAEIAAALHLGVLAPGQGVAAQQAAYLRALQATSLPDDHNDNSGFTLHAANALWGATGYHFNPAYLALLQSGFGATLHTQNFSNPSTARAAINGWVAAETHNKIPNLIGPGLLGAGTRLVLTNAIYFNATWDQPFHPRDTSPAPFHTAPGQTITTAMMHQTNDYPLAAIPGAHVLSMDYSGGRASMVIILPDAPFGLSAIESSLSAASLTNVLTNALNGGPSTLVALSLPKFTTQSQFTLGGVLRALGVKQVFSAHANLTGIASNPADPLRLSAVIHQAQISVDETATKAAASTTMSFAATAMPPIAVTAQPVPFNADHPFLYLIRDNRTGAILFMGRLASPPD